MVLTDKSNIPGNSSTPGITRQWILAEYPREQLDVLKTFRLVETPLYFEEGHRHKARNRILVKSLWFSNDPAQRMWMDDKLKDQMHIKPARKGDVINAMAIGEVIESFHPDYKKGDLVRGYFGWTEYILMDTDDQDTMSTLDLLKIPPKMDPVDFLATGLAVLTAYFGLLKIGAPTPKDRTIVVSDAASATGSTITQIAKNILGIEQVLGIVDSDEKCAVIKEKCGVDVALNYKSRSFREDYEKATPGCVDIYFDNVGGEILDMNLDRLAKLGRVVACGPVSSCDDTAREKGMVISAKGYEDILSKRGHIERFIVTDFANEFKEASAEIREWVMQGKLHPLKTVWKAKFEDVPYGMEKLLQGDNVGTFVTELIEV